MNPTFRNILAVVAGVVVGSIVNMGIIQISGKIIPPPEGADLTSIEGLKASMHLFQPKNFLMPFLAHALGTLAGAFLAAKLSVKNHMRSALVIGLVFLIGGILNVTMLPAPMWFNAVDLIFAYFPMAYLGGKLGTRG